MDHALVRTRVPICLSVFRFAFDAVMIRGSMQSLTTPHTCTDKIPWDMLLKNTSSAVYERTLKLNATRAVVRS